MASYVVLTPPDTGRFHERAVLIRDGFAFWALVAPVIWLLWFRLWFQAAIVLLASVAVALLTNGWPDWDPVFLIGSLLVSIYVALEGNAMRIAKKERQDWTVQDVVVAPNRAIAEEIYFSAEVQGDGRKRNSAPASSTAARTPQQSVQQTQAAVSGPALGLLDVGTRS
jgi:hypothetical protein